MRKTIPHIIYISLILFLLFRYLNEKRKFADIQNMATKVNKTVSWTFGVDYEELTPINSNKELNHFINKVQKLVEQKKWDAFFNLIEKDEDFKMQFEDLGSSKEKMILNDLEVYSTSFDNITIENSFPELLEGKEIEILKTISELDLIGIDEGKTYGVGIITTYGYIKLENGLIKAVTLMFIKTEEGYRITGPVG